jgi:Neocarzinostatin family
MYDSSRFRPWPCVRGSWRSVAAVALTGAIVGACSVPTSSSVPALTVDHPTLAVSPAVGLKDGQVVQVSVAGFGVGGKVFLSECASAEAASYLGCGAELAAQTFLVTDENRAGAASLTVRASAAGKAPSTGPLTPCADRCVIMATLGSVFVVAPIAFAIP